MLIACLAVFSGLTAQGVLGTDFAGNLAGCAENNPLNQCLRETLDDLRPLMLTGIPELGLPRTEPMNVDVISFNQGAPPVKISAQFSNVVVTGLSNFQTNYIDANPNTQTLRIGLTVPEMNIEGFYQINGEVFILPLEGSGTFTTKMSGVTATGSSNIVPLQSPDGSQVIRVENTDIDFQIGDVFIRMENLFNGENKLLADTVNNFLNDHGQDVLSEVKPEISRQLEDLVTRVMNDAFSELPADNLLNNLNRSVRSGLQTQTFSGPSISGNLQAPTFPGAGPQASTFPGAGPQAPTFPGAGPQAQQQNFQPNQQRSGQASLFAFLSGGRKK